MSACGSRRDVEMILIRIISTVATLAQMVFLALALFESVPSFAETFSVSTASFSLRFEIGPPLRDTCKSSTEPKLWTFVVPGAGGSI